MHAVTIEDGKLSWTTHPAPVPQRGELLVEVRAAGLNAGDLLQLRGLYPAPPGSPADIPGLEAAGVVVAVGDDVSTFEAGDRVCAVVGGGGQAEQLVVHERCAIALPDSLGWAEAGGFAEAFTTAHDALFTQAGLRSGERVLVQGAAGGVGVAGVQLAVAAGAAVTASVRNTDLHSRVAALGADVVEPGSATDAGPFDVVLELVGGPNLPGDVAALAPGGRICVIGVGAGAKTELNLLALMAARGRIHGSTLRARPLESKAAAAQRVSREVMPLIESGRVSVPVAATYTMGDASSAYEHFATGGKFGKIVLLTDGV